MAWKAGGLVNGVPYGPDGEVQEYARTVYVRREEVDRRGLWHRVTINKPGTEYVGVGPGWRAAQRFEAVMRVADFERGRSAAHLVVKDGEGKTYTLFLADLMEVIERAGIEAGGEVLWRWWEPVKRGQNYGVRMAEEPTPMERVLGDEGVMDRAARLIAERDGIVPVEGDEETRNERYP